MRFIDRLSSKIRSFHLKRLRRRMFSPVLQLRNPQCFDGYRLDILDGPDFYVQYKDFFIRRIYHFQAVRPDPLIIDGGGNIGMSVLCFKQLYPKSRIIAFEPDPAVFAVLRKNMQTNHLTGVELINAGLGPRKERRCFIPDGKSGGRVVDGQSGIEVSVECLSDYLKEPVDFLKLNIEGAESDVLHEAAAAGTLRNVRETVIEYHGWPQAGQTLGPLLALLDREGFRYLVHDFDSETCPASKPPFHLDPTAPWFCLIYAKYSRNSESNS